MAAKRGNREGSVYKTADGRWRGSLTLPGGKRKYLTGRTRDEVSRKLTRALHEREQGILTCDERQTVSMFLDRWLRDTVKPNRKPRTYEFYESKIRLYINPAIGKVRLTKLSPQHVNEMLSGLLIGDLSPQTVVHVRRVLVTALGQAEKWGMVTRNVAALTDAPTTTQFEAKQLSRQQVKDFLRSLEGSRLEALYHLALGLGMRKAELLGLCWSDVDLEGRQLRVINTLQHIRRQGPRLVPPKTKRSQRTLPLTPEVVTILGKHRRRQNRNRLIAGSRWKGWPDGDLVFTTSVGTPIEQGNLSRHFKIALERAGLPGIRFHDLRGTFGTLMASEGIPPRTLMELMGHSQISTTMEIYAQVLPEDKQTAVETIQRLISGTAS